MENNKIVEVIGLAAYLRGVSAVVKVKEDSDTLYMASEWLSKTARNICSQGVFGCNGGITCTLSHK